MQSLMYLRNMSGYRTDTRCFEKYKGDCALKKQSNLGRFSKYNKISQLIHTQSIAN